MAGARSRLSDPEFAKQVAELYIRGVSKDEMAITLDCAPETIRVWVRDPRVQAHAKRFAVERVNRITRRIDGEMEARLANVDDWSLEELLRVRKEYLERPLKVAAADGVDEGSATDEIAEAMDEDAGFAEELSRLVEAARDRR